MVNIRKVLNSSQIIFDEYSIHSELPKYPMTLNICSLHKSKSFLKYKFKTVTIGKMITLFRKCGHCLWILLTISNNLLPHNNSYTVMSKTAYLAQYKQNINNN